MLFTGQMIDASRALALGLVDELVPSNPEQVAIAHSARMAESSRYSVGNTKKMIHAIVNGMSAPSQAMVDQFVDAFDGPDYLEGVAAFRDRRKPKFS
jgi:enoyl-CoA hydratase/carnithine racemase